MTTQEFEWLQQRLNHIDKCVDASRTEAKSHWFELREIVNRHEKDIQSVKTVGKVIGWVLGTLIGALGALGAWAHKP